MIINVFKNKIFPLNDISNYPQYSSEKDISPKSSTSSDSEYISRKDKLSDSLSSSFDEFDQFLLDSEKDLDPRLTKSYFFNDSLSELYNYLIKSRGSYYNKSRTVVIKSRLEKLKNYIRNMSEDEVKDKKLRLLVDLVEGILDYSKQLNMAPLKSEGQGLKILTPKQMIVRLPILLAQLKAGNNSEQLKNEIRQLV